MYEAGLVCALAIVGGIASRSYNVEGTGLNNYIALISSTGTGKGIIPKCFSRVITEVTKHVPGAASFKGMGFIASGQAIIRSLSDKPHPVSICMLDEIGHDLEEMANPRNLNGRSKEKVLLQLWGLSGKGNVFEPMAYADTDKNTKPLESPALTFVGTTTPQKFNEYLGESSAANGMLARLLIVENTGEIPPDNEFHEINFNSVPPHIVAAINDLAGYALKLSNERQIIDVAFAPEARAYIKEYREVLRRRLNAASEGPQRQLWNRASEKAIKLAATLAVGCNYLVPCITFDQMKWAIDFIELETHRQIAKFNTGDVGEASGNETRQVNELIKAIGLYMSTNWNDLPPIGGVTEEMHRDGVFSQTWLSRHLLNRAAFKGRDATRALKVAIDNLLNGDEIVEISKLQMQPKYGRAPRSFCVKIPDRFVTAALRASP